MLGFRSWHMSTGYSACVRWWLSQAALLGRAPVGAGALRSSPSAAGQRSTRIGPTGLRAGGPTPGRVWQWLVEHRASPVGSCPRRVGDGMAFSRRVASLFEEVSADHDPLDVAGALPDVEDLQIAVPLLDQMVF